MAVYNKLIVIQKLNNDTEKWADYYPTHANVNKASGKEYYNARTDISSSTMIFSVRYCKELKDIMYNTDSYRVLFENRHFDIKNVDDYKLEHNELNIVGDFNGKYIN